MGAKQGRRRKRAKLVRADSRLAVTYRPTESLSPYSRNARTHSEKQVAQIMASILEFGWTNPILIDEDGEVVAGHGRLLAAISMDYGTVPCVVLEGLSEEQRKAYRLADNKLPLNAGWDEDLLKVDLLELKEADFELELIGFEDDELIRITQGIDAGRGDPNAVPEDVPKRCQAGHLWGLGGHRLLCGDSTSEGDVGRLLGDARPILCVTDPPYGVNYDPAWRNEAAAKGQLPHAVRRVGNLQNDDRTDWSEVWAAMPCEILYHWTAGRGDLSIEAGLSIRQAGFQIRNQVIWSKPHFPISRGHYTYRHEFCWYAVRKGRKAHWIGDNKQSTLWEVNLDKNVPGGHSTQKPVELFTRAITNHRGDVYEPFCGSGTGLIACQQLSRTCYAMELDRHYCDTILARWEAFTGEKAVLLEDSDK